MGKKHKQHRHRNRGAEKPTPSSSVTGKNSVKGRTKNRTKGMLLVAALVIVAGGVVYALNAPKGTKRDSGRAPAEKASLQTTPPPQQALLSTPPSAALPTGVSRPRIHFASLVHDFGKMKGGEVAKHTYVFTNLGDQLLEVTEVRASCGCTTAGEWSRKVDPGQTGSIPIEFNSGSFSGPVAKSITVTCNDRSQPTVALQLKATVWKPIEVTPQFATLNVTAESPSNSTTVRIVSNEEAPLALFSPESDNPAFSAELRTNQAGKEFQLIVKTVPPLPAGRVQGQITLKTSSTNMPVINVRTWANVQQAVVVMPSQISLPAAPLTNETARTITIRNNAANPLTLREPEVNAKAADVQLKETQPGRNFMLTVRFPAGFEIAQGETVELSVKSNHPQFPIIKVPVRQALRPVPSAVSPPRKAKQSLPPPLPPGAGGQ